MNAFPTWPPRQPDRYRIRFTEFDSDGHMAEHDLGEVRIREGEIATFFCGEDGVPFVSVIPKCEAGE